MSKSIKKLLHDHLYAIIDTIGESVTLFIAVGSGIIVRWGVEQYLSGIDEYLFWAAQLIADVWIVIGPAIALYRKASILWINARADIRKARDKAKP